MNFLAILISLAMMLTGAGGEGQPAEASRTLLLHNINITYGDESVSLNPALRVGATTDGEKAVFDVGVDVDGDTLFPIQLGVDESGLTALFAKSDVAVKLDAEAFDALNDVRNLEQAIRSTRKYGGQVEAALSYTISPIHNEEYFVKLAKELEQMGADTICIKDMANLLLPMDAYSLVKALKEHVSVPIHLHTHNTTGTGDMVNLMAAYAGVDIVDTALSPMANGTSQPATESLAATLKGTVRDPGLDMDKMSEAAVHFREVAARLESEGILNSKVLRVDTNTLRYQVPGGMPRIRRGYAEQILITVIGKAKAF